MNSVTKEKLPSHAMGKDTHTHTLYNSQILHKSVPWPTAEAQIQSQVSPYRIYGGQGGTKRGCPTSTSVLTCQYQSNSAPYSFIHSPNANAMLSQQLTVSLNTTIKTDTSLHNQQSSRRHFHGSYSHRIYVIRILENYG